jgi:hypothetical protein
MLHCLKLRDNLLEPILDPLKLGFVGELVRAIVKQIVTFLLEGCLLVNQIAVALEEGVIHLQVPLDSRYSFGDCFIYVML